MNLTAASAGQIKYVICSKILLSTRVFVSGTARRNVAANVMSAYVCLSGCQSHCLSVCLLHACKMQNNV